MRHTCIVNSFGGEFPAPKVWTWNYHGSTYHSANNFAMKKMEEIRK